MISIRPAPRRPAENHIIFVKSARLFPAAARHDFTCLLSPLARHPVEAEGEQQMTIESSTSRRAISRNTTKAVDHVEAQHYLINSVMALGTGLIFSYIPAHLHGVTYHLDDRAAAMAFSGLAVVFGIMGLAKARRARLAGR
ncbi:hypothetical protein SIL87_13355 [Acidiphilium acidophilum]|uniref:Uncharacterized protein n=2 Tax=Acidiphilium acidophilum TaxID=76588 RepID=A0AAW9DRG9_ACIAO|nr:hypothetical protein [Acidiphilium acidophilum]